MSELDYSSFEIPPESRGMDLHVRATGSPYAIDNEIDMGGDTDIPSKWTGEDVSEELDMGLDDVSSPDDAYSLRRNRIDRQMSETLATTEVQRAMAEIEHAEQQIADHTGLSGEALADATDEYLVEKAEHKQLVDAPDTAGALEEALIEGALEAAGNRPLSQDNPILHLERDGFDIQITSGVEHLAEQDARLPNGESAAEVVAATLAAHETEQSDSDPERTNNSLETAMHYYVQGSSKEDVQKYTGIDPSLISKYIKELPDEQREYYQGMRKEALFAKEAKQKLQDTHPELFEGRVAPEFEAILKEAGYDSYAVGFNQHDAIADWEEATQYMEENGGVEMVGYGPNQRFLIHDSESPSENYPMGYYSARVGRFVYAFPVENGADSAPRVAASVAEGIPGDTFIPNAEGEEVANIKYCVGFIDGDQVFNLNEKFMSKVEESGEIMDYDKESKEAGWDSPERAQKLVEKYIVPGAKVLDIGIGTGQAVKGYADKGATIIGLDHDQAMLTAAQQVVGESGQLRQADINKVLPVSDLVGQVDVAQAVGVLEFAQDIGNVFTQVNKAQKNGSVFVFTAEILGSGGTQAEASTAYPEAGVVVHRHTVDEINKLLIQSGYTLTKYDSYGAYERDGGKVPYTIFMAKKFKNLM